MQKMLIAFGGNAILPAGQSGTYEEQLANIRRSCKKIVDLALAGHSLVITHGNGPQVGNLLIQNESASNQVPPQPLHTCVAQTQGQLGYMIQGELDNELRRRGSDIATATLITRVLVDKNDEAFRTGTKPIGPFFSEKRAKERINLGETWINDSNRGWRRVVPSPGPVKILEIETIKKMIDPKLILLVGGGGGIPVILDENQINGVDAVIDKDLTSSLLARELDLDIMILLTDIDRVKLNFHHTNEKPISKMTVNEAKRYIEEGQFGIGSMAPKIQAALDFVGPGKKKAIITSFEHLEEALAGRAGTCILA